VKRILLVRHGESEWNSVRRLQGQADIDLTQTGRSQAIALRATVAALRPDRTLSSDLKRARETAVLLGREDAEPTPALREIDVGAWTGAQISQLIASEGENYRGWRAGTFVPPGGELWADFRDRTFADVDTALRAGAKRLLVVCHGGVIRALLESLVGLPPHKIVPVGPASLSIVAVRDEDHRDIRLELFNFRPDGPVLDSPD
jgi:probable phosphoglycerate mutase